MRARRIEALPDPATASERRAWERLAAAEGLDPRREPWCWHPAGRLLLRSARAQRLATALGGDLADAAIHARRAETWQVSASRCALRQGPAHSAEQISQLRLGDRFRVWHWDAAREWAWGAGEDGYPGWLRAWHLRPGAPPPPTRVVCARWSRALVAPSADAAPLLDLSFGTRLAPAGRPQAGYLPWQAPDGRRAWTALADLAPWPLRTPGGAAGELLGRGRALLGVPYEWGGASSAGLDCSGFVQLLFGSLGRRLPRDADLQADCGHPVALDAPARWAAGDLVFYGERRVDHVGILAEGMALLHASGELCLEPLGPDGRLRGRQPRLLRRLA